MSDILQTVVCVFAVDSFVREMLTGDPKGTDPMDPDGDDLDIEEAPAPPRKRQKTANKEYIPGIGTANYAFLIALFQVLLCKS